MPSLDTYYRTTQAVCACATHLLDRIWTILKEDRPYELRDVDGTPVTTQQACLIIAERYTVPKEVRQRNNQRAHKMHPEQQAEKKYKKESRPNKLLENPSGLDHAKGRSTSNETRRVLTVDSSKKVRGESLTPSE